MKPHTNINQHLDNVQNARIVTLDCIFLELLPFENEKKKRFCDLILSTL